MYRGRHSGSSRGYSRGHAPWLGNWRGRGTYQLRGEDKHFKGAIDESPLGCLIMEISLEDAKNSASSVEDAKIKECRHVGSYSLIDSDLQKIVVPGQPAAWDPPQLPSQLRGDYGEYLRDHNGARFPKHPMQAAVQSVLALNEGFDPSGIDIMGCASTLGDILRFTRSVELTFRFDVEMVGNTLFLIRNCKKEIIPDVRGYGHSFLDAFTSYGDDVNGTKSHQRIIAYTFGGLKCLVRFECDGYFVSKNGVSTVVRGLDRLNLPETSAANSITMEKAGKIVPQDMILEIKTMSQARGQIDKSSHLPRLWLRQIPNFITAYHIRGNFEDVRKESLQEDLVNWEIEHEPELQDFASTLRCLIIEVKRASHLKLELYRTGTGPLQLRQRGGEAREALPKEWMDIWAGNPPEELGQGDQDTLSDDDESYPRDNSDESEDSDGNFLFDLSACGPSCGYCGHCG
ncbi:hypothetical protein F4779DRAFT_637469 [Xylariaceae sp. FL0662B]|nr:hypothetical protein F4779DRAFT_637469 [Xylariaceae sp. FL0662B]